MNVSVRVDTCRFRKLSQVCANDNNLLNKLLTINQTTWGRESEETAPDNPLRGPLKDVA